MVLDKKDVGKLQKKGATIVGSGGKEVKAEIDYLREISSLLRMLLNKPSESKEVVQSAGAPIVNVQPTPVTVNFPQEQEPKKWKFEVKKNEQGQTTEIIATAME